MSDDGSRLLNIAEVSKILGLSESWVRQRVASNDIPHIRLGGGIRFLENDLTEWIHSHKVSAQ